MDNSPSPASYLVSASHRTAHLHVQQHPLTHCHPTLPFVQVARKPPFAFHSPALDLTGQTMASPHPFQLNLNDNLFSITHCRPASSCQPVPSELGLHLSTGTGQKGERCPGPPDQNSMSPWPLPTGAGRPPGITASRPWPKVAGLTPEVFLPGGDTRPYNGFLLEPTDSGPSFSPDVEVFNTAALSVVPTPIIVTDTPRRDQPQDVAVYFSGSESDSGLEPDDERSIVRGTRQDQWTSISTASPRTKSPDVTLSRRSASFLATQEIRLGSSPLPRDVECPARATRRARSSSRKPKMHQCQTCKKWFPRPSGLATHMNVHSGAKPFTCPVQSCNKKFAVRSNAKRHLRTHGIMPTPDMSFISTPVEDNDVAVLADTACWTPRTLKERNLKFEALDSCPLLISELPLVRPSTYMWGGEVVYEERDSFSDAPIAPYHPAYWRCLPGPAPATAAACVSPT